MGKPPPPPWQVPVPCKMILQFMGFLYPRCVFASATHWDAQWAWQLLLHPLVSDLADPHDLYARNRTGLLENCNVGQPWPFIPRVFLSSPTWSRIQDWWVQKKKTQLDL